MTSPVPQTIDAWTVAPFVGPLADDVRHLVSRLDPAQRLWLSGYLAGSAEPAPETPAAAGSSRPPVTVLFGSQSGNSERLAGELAEALNSRGINHRLLDMIDCRKSDLQEAHTLLVVVSTHGEGDPPDRALPLHELLHSRKAPSLGHAKYAVLALGDSSYEKYCETGRQFDARLGALGAELLLERVECDVDFEMPAREWVASIADKLAESAAAGPRPAATLVRPMASLANAYTRKNPFAAPVLTNQRLTASTSTKDVRHVELALDESGIRYEPGDALGIVPRNHEPEVDALLESAGFEPGTPVPVDGEATELREALLRRFDIGPPTTAQLQRYAEATHSAPLATLLRQPAAELATWLHGRHLADIIAEHPPTGLDAESFVRLLRPLAPRLYSIASSQRATPDEVHLTVSLVAYESLGRRHQGVVSGLVAGLGDEASAPVYLHRNPNFRLPADPSTAIIMIGPGTGVAPFRSFVAEREAIDARGRNWLFFGDRHFATDFLYQTDWLAWRKAGFLNRIDIAFSRDGADKVYVQDRLRAQGADVWAWLQDGAHLYVCGDATHMAPDVHGALLDIVAAHGGLSEERAAEYLVDLQRERRYQRDVY